MLSSVSAARRRPVRRRVYSPGFPEKHESLWIRPPAFLALFLRVRRVWARIGERSRNDLQGVVRDAFFGLRGPAPPGEAQIILARLQRRRRDDRCSHHVADASRNSPRSFRSSLKTRMLVDPSTGFSRFVSSRATRVGANRGTFTEQFAGRSPRCSLRSPRRGAVR
jgi:hypothetical protein